VSPPWLAASAKHVSVSEPPNELIGKSIQFFNNDSHFFASRSVERDVQTEEKDERDFQEEGEDEPMAEPCENNSISPSNEISIGPFSVLDGTSVF
jgi:hypothetical protein